MIQDDCSCTREVRLLMIPHIFDELVTTVTWTIISG